MIYGRIPGIDKDVSRLIQGTVMISTRDLDGSFRLLDAVYELGCNTFDTAHAYGKGDSERTLGKWVSERRIREQVIIITKGAHPAGHNRVTPVDIASDLSESLERLNTDYVDLYLLHRDDPSVPVGPIVETLNEHRSAGRVHAFGGSNWTHGRIAEANDYARTHGLLPFAASSPNFSLAEQVNPPWDGCITISGQDGEAARKYYAEEGMPLLAWSSLAGGFFSVRFRRDNLDTFQDGLDKLCVTSYCTEENFRRLDRARVLAERKDLSIAQIALAWFFSQPMNVFALTGCRRGEEFTQNVAALTTTLTEKEAAWLDLKAEAP